MDNIDKNKRKSLHLIKNLFISSLFVGDFLFARNRHKKTQIEWKSELAKNKTKKELNSLYQRPYNAFLYFNYLKDLKTNIINLNKDKKDINNLLFFNIHIWTIQTKELTKKSLKNIYFNYLKNKKSHLRKKKHGNKNNNKTDMSNNKENNNLNIKDIDIEDVVLHYSGNSYLTVLNLIAFKKYDLAKTISIHLKHKKNLSLKEFYLKNIWDLYNFNTMKEPIKIDVIDLKIKDIEKRIFSRSFAKQSKKFRDKKFLKKWKSIKKNKRNYLLKEEDFYFAYLLSLLSFYYSLKGYSNYSLLFLNKIKEVFLDKTDPKSIMFYYYINFIGFFLTKKYIQAISYYNTILNLDAFPYYEESAFVLFFKAALKEFKNKNYRLSWEYSDYALKYGVKLDPNKFIDQLILIKKTLKESSDKYIEELKAGNNYDIINYVKSETAKSMGLIF